MNDLEELAARYLVNEDEDTTAPVKKEPPRAERVSRTPPARTISSPTEKETSPRIQTREVYIPVSSFKQQEPEDDFEDFDEEPVRKPKKVKKVKPKKQKKAKKAPTPDYYDDDYAEVAVKKPNHVGRFFLCLFTLLLMLIITIASVCLVISYGPSPTIRNICVLSAKQASATKWVPGLFLSEKTIQDIMDASNSVNTDVVAIDDIISEEEDDEWANAVDGMKLIFRQEPNYKAYVLLIKDPSRVNLGISSDNFAGATAGMRIFEIADKYKCVAAINGGEFADPGGQGTGAQPIGLTYSQGKCVWGSSTGGTFIGFDKDNNLVCVEGLSKAKADEMGIRDGCCFMYKNVIIERDGDNVKLNYADDNLGIAQKTAIGQRADGTVIMIVTDGRSAESVGATRNDMIDLMVEYGAVTAGSLDGGSSSMLYYRDYWDAYKIDKDGLDEYQQQGLVNRYKAFTKPRRIPTYFIVMPGDES